MEGIAESDVAIEVSTAGLRKPVGEIYPAPAVPGDVPGGRPAGGAVVRRARARAARLRLRASASSWLDRDRGVDGELAVFERPQRAAARSSIGMSACTRARASATTPIASRRAARCVLGGVEIPGAELGLAGHSDADVLTHASSTRCSAPPASATSASTSPTTTPRTRARTRSSCSSDVCTFLEDHGWTVRHVDATRDLRAAEARLRIATPCATVAGARRSGSSRASQRQVHDQRGHGLGRPGRGQWPALAGGARARTR